MTEVYEPDRISKISKIMPQFSSVAEAGDTVLMGLEGDPAFPYANTRRPMATVDRVDRDAVNGTPGTLRLPGGSTGTINEHTIAPPDAGEAPAGSRE